MSARHGKNAYVKWGSDDISTYCTTATWDSSKDEAEVTTFTASAKSFVGGLQDNMLELEGPFHETIDGKLGADYIAGTDRAVEYATNGGTASSTNPKYSWTTGTILNYSVETAVDGAARFTCSIRLNGTTTRAVA
jgi:hypothetical protein